MTLTKADLATNLSESTGFSKRETMEIVECFFSEIAHILVDNQSIKLTNFGRFGPRDKPARPGRNPRTLEEKTISARRVITFHASQCLKEKVEQYHGEPTTGDDESEADSE